MTDTGTASHEMLEWLSSLKGSVAQEKLDEGYLKFTTLVVSAKRELRAVIIEAALEPEHSLTRMEDGR